MKKLFILFAASVVTLAANAQSTQMVQVSKKEMKHEKHTERKEERKELKKLEGTEPTYQAKESFLGDFGDVPDATWKREKFFDVVSFTLNGVPQTAYYDSDAELVGTVFTKTFADLPLSAQKYINKKYAGYQKGRVIMFDDNEYNDTDMELYGVQFEDADNYFIEMAKGGKDIVLQVTPEGGVYFFSEIR